MSVPPSALFDECELKHLAERLHHCKVVNDMKKAALEATRIAHDTAREELNEAYSDYNETHGKILKLIHGESP